MFSFVNNINTHEGGTHLTGLKSALTTVINKYLQPVGVTSEYSVVTVIGGAAGWGSVDLGGVNEFSFVWGSPDTYNSIAIYSGDSVTTISGNTFASVSGLKANGDNKHTRLFTITATGDSTIDSLKFMSTGIAFETAVAAPVPEPQTYALMLAGLGAIGFIRRRSRRA